MESDGKKAKLRCQKQKEMEMAINKNKLTPKMQVAEKHQKQLNDRNDVFRIW